MAWTMVDEFAGMQPIETVSDVQQHLLGVRCRARNAEQGECEFIYVKGLASVAVGEGVSYDGATGLLVRTVAATRGPVGIAMSALVANTYGWVQVFGKAICKVGTVASGGSVWATATPGTLDDATLTGALWSGASFKSATDTPATGFAYAQIAYPAMVGLG